MLLASCVHMPSFFFFLTRWKCPNQIPALLKTFSCTFPSAQEHPPSSEAKNPLYIYAQHLPDPFIDPSQPIRVHPSALPSSLIAPNAPTVQSSHFHLDPLRSLLCLNPLGCSHSRSSLTSQGHSVPLLWALLPSFPHLSFAHPAMISSHWLHEPAQQVSQVLGVLTGYFRVFAFEATLGIPLPRYPYDSGHSLASIAWFKYLWHQLKLPDYHFSYYFTASYFYLLNIFAAWGYWEGGGYESIKTRIIKLEKLGTRSH